MSIIVVPDIHESVERISEIEAQAGRAGRIICLGDYFDSFTHSRAKALEILNWIIGKLDNPYWTFLLGNHDVHYLWPDIGRSPGWAQDTQDLINAIPPGLRNRLRELPFAVAGEGFLFSHAGVNHKAWPEGLTSAADAVEWLDREGAKAKAVRSRKDHWFHQAGVRRGGMEPLGGPLWLDWEDFQPHETIPQIVGHTPSKTARAKGSSWCIDAGMRQVLLIDGYGQLQFKSIGFGGYRL